MSDANVAEYSILDRVFNIPLNGTVNSLRMGSYKTSHHGNEAEHALIYSGVIHAPEFPILLRINSACYTSDIFHSQSCDCNWQLKQAMDRISIEGGLLIYHFHHEGKALGFTHKLRMMQLLEEGSSGWETWLRQHYDTDTRRFYSTIKILQDLGIQKVRLMTNNPRKREALVRNGIDVVETIPIVTQAPELRFYLTSKRHILGHEIQFDHEI